LKDRLKHFAYFCPHFTALKKSGIFKNRFLTSVPFVRVLKQSNASEIWESHKTPMSGIGQMYFTNLTQVLSTEKMTVQMRA